jgi:predicted nucleic acid-binding protein
LATHFFDSSAAVKRYVRETGSGWVLGLVGPSSGNRNYVAAITGVEVVSAIARQQRAGHLSPTDAAAATTSFRHDFAREYQTIEISPGLIGAAMALAETHALRGYDAVQLAAALEVHAQCVAAGTTMMLVSSDTALNLAALAEGLTVDDPNTHP